MILAYAMAYQYVCRRYIYDTHIDRTRHTYNNGVAMISRLPNIQVSLAKEPYKTVFFLQKRPMI